VFLQGLDGEWASLGIGKQIDRIGGRCTVEYFDAPTVDRVVQCIDASHLESVTLPEQTRVYCFNEAINAWETGRLLKDYGTSQFIQFPNKETRYLKTESVFVRWARPIVDPTPFLASKINENPRFSDDRRRFTRSVLSQRAASMGMSALLASAVELEAHQIEVVRRILQDPVQRYLLADEVGLGKTIEAGVLIRQCVLDAVEGYLILVIVPEALIAQWRAELAAKFFLGNFLDKTVYVLPMTAVEQIRPLLTRATMLVIDEVHHLTGRQPIAERSIYRDIAKAAPTIERILLISATPALHNERGFFKILHLLDPQTYTLDDEADFRRKVEGRQALAEIVAGLTPENALYLDYTIDQLSVRFPDDALLQEQALKLREILDTLPSEDDPGLIDAVGKLHAHLSEVYRLDRRILRHRRRSIGGVTPDRSGAQIIEYSSASMVALRVAIDDWRFAESTAFDGDEAGKSWTDRVRDFRLIIDRASQYPRSGSGIVGFLALRRATVGNAELLRRIAKCLGRPGLFDDRVKALLGALPPLLACKAKIVIFCSDPETADALTNVLATRLNVRVDRHNPDDEAWRRFNLDLGRPILVCDWRAEEGLNLQGGRKFVVHYDVPLDPNRIEQRLGRVDRYGAGDAVASLVLKCRDNPIEANWIDYLNAALKVFDRSIASLQYLVDETKGSLAASLFTDGAEALIDLTERSTGDDGIIEREIRNIDNQDALDALGAPPTDLLDNLSEIDADWRAIEADINPWIEQTLQFTRAEVRIHGLSDVAREVPFRYCYETSNQSTLIPFETFVHHCRSAIELMSWSPIRRMARTIPYTYNRRMAVRPEARSKGVGLLRYGDPFVSGMWDITQADDRGRSSALWRFVPGYHGDCIADIFFRFDFVVEVDLRSIRQALAEVELLMHASDAAIGRRGDMALPPFFETVWLDQELASVEAPEILDLLTKPYAPDSHRQDVLDYNLDAPRWQRVVHFDIPQLAYWPDLCQQARARAENELCAKSELSEKLALAVRHAETVDARRLGQLRARARGGGTTTSADSYELHLEERLSSCLRTGIQSPRIRVDAIGAIFLSGDRNASLAVGGGG
jgi:ATP-dependent helicase HepA